MQSSSSTSIPNTSHHFRMTKSLTEDEALAPFLKRKAAPLQKAWLVGLYSTTLNIYRNYNQYCDHRSYLPISNSDRAHFLQLTLQPNDPRPVTFARDIQGDIFTDFWEEHYGTNVELLRWSNICNCPPSLYISTKLHCVGLLPLLHRMSLRTDNWLTHNSGR